MKLAATATTVVLALAATACMPESRDGAAGAEAARSSTTTASVPTVAPPSEQPTTTMTTDALTIHLQELDRNGDRFIARDELEADHRLMMNFATYDTNTDGRISEAEFAAYMQANTD